MDLCPPTSCHGQSGLVSASLFSDAEKGNELGNTPVARVAAMSVTHRGSCPDQSKQANTRLGSVLSSINLSINPRLRTLAPRCVTRNGPWPEQTSLVPEKFPDDEVDDEVADEVGPARCRP